MEKIKTERIKTDCADPSARAENTRAFLAALYRHGEACDVALLQELLDKGVDPDLRDSWGHAPLTQAAKYGFTGICRGLLAAGADVNQKDGYGLTPLIWAARFDRADTLALLVEKGAALEERSPLGYTALMVAVWENKLSAVEVLAGKGADPEARDPAGKTAFDCAFERSFFEAWNILVEARRAAEERRKELEAYIQKGMPITGPVKLPKPLVLKKRKP